MESVVNIPFGYDPDRDRVLPICLPARDDDGQPIAWGWFEAVARIENPLRKLTRFALGDEVYVSELTETALKIVWKMAELVGSGVPGRPLARDRSGAVATGPSARWIPRARQARQPLGPGPPGHRRDGLRPLARLPGPQRRPRSILQPRRSGNQDPPARLSPSSRRGSRRPARA